MISTDLFMEINGDLVWLVDDDVIDYADNVKRSFRPDVYPEASPSLTKEDRKKLKASSHYYKWGRGRFDWLFRFPKNPKSNFEWYKMLRRRRKRMV